MEKMDTGKQNQTVVKSVSLANVKRRLEVEKKRIANLRKGRLETKTTPPKSPKTAPVMKRKGERRSVETEVPKKKVATQAETSKKKVETQTEVAKKKVDSQTEVAKKKVDSQAEVPKKKPDSQAETSKKKVETQAELSKKIVDSQDEVSKKKVDSQTEVPKKKVDSQTEVPKKKVDSQTEVPKKKVDSPTKSPGKSTAASSVGTPETSTRKRSTKPPSPKATPIPDQEQESTPEKKTSEEKDMKSDAEEDSEEDQTPLAALVTGQKESKPESEQSGKLPPDTEYTVGYRLEAKDFNNDWYPARVVEVDYDDREVLVHFDRWSSRYDEWINMDSPRLRAPGPLSNQSTTKPSKSASKQKSSTPVKPATPATPEKQAPPVATTVAPPVVAAVTTTPSVAPTTSPALPRTFKVGDQVMASWSDSRKYPAKIVEVLENDMYNVLFFDGFMKSIKGNRITPGLRPGTQMETVTTPEVISTVPASPYPPEEDIGSKADRRERKRKINVCELFSMKRRASPPAKSPASSSVQSPTTKSTPVHAKSTNKPATSTDAPPPTKKSKKQHQKLQSPGQEDLLLIKSLTSTPAVDANKAKTRSSPATSSTELRRVRTLLPRTRSDDSSPVLEPPPPHNPFTRSAAAASNTVTQETAPQTPLASILEGIEVEMEEGNFKCPSEGCGKLYRKENLLQMHIKHYHPELKSRLMVVPKVLDLAYARTVGDLPSTAVTPRNMGSSSSPASGPAVNQRKSLTLQAPPKKMIKTEKLATEEAPVEKSPPPVIDLPQTSRPASPASSPAKPGQIKTLLPINRSPEDKVAKPVVEPPPPQPLSALQQALMSPPGHLSALLQSPNKPTYDHRPKTVVKHEAKPVFHPSTRNHISPGSPRGRNMRDERSPNKELVNCMCGVPEEDGLMIQCDLCMCWQHGLCNMIETEEQVPEKYVCYICLHPARERQSRKYAHDQDWLKEGTLPRMPIRRNQGRVVRTNTELLLKETHDITAAILHLQQVIHSLRVKINIAEKSDHPKLYLWSKRWESDDDKSLLPSKQEEDIKPETADVKQEFAIETLALANEEIKSELDTEAKSGTTDGDMKPGSSNENGKLGSEEENMKPASSTDDELKSGSQEDADLHLALNLPLSQSELEHLANTVEHKLRSTEESQAVVPMVSTPVPQAKAPEPEAPIQLASCRLVLLEHIERYQAKLEARLAELELRADQLEARDPELAGVCERDQTSNTKDTLRMLQRDLDSVNKISEYATSD